MSDAKVKVCSGSCKQEKSISEFYLRRDRPNGRQSRCKECDNGTRWEGGRFKDTAHKEHIYAINKASYDRNKDKYQKRANQKNVRNKLRALEAHGAMACKCGQTHPAALDFHHRDPSTKCFDITYALVRPDQFSWQEILDEIAKCDVVCASCHRIHHASSAYGELVV